MKIKIGVSGCLLGNRVRYDGADKLDKNIVDTLGHRLDLVSICPEVGAGLGVPRPPVRLVSQGGEVRALGIDDSSLDVTAALVDYALGSFDTCRQLSGYIFKSRSPSCGVKGVKLFDSGGRVSGRSSGVFAATLSECLPLMPVVEEWEMEDAARRENFLTRVVVYHRWLQLFNAGMTLDGLKAFHEGARWLFMVHNMAAYRRLARRLGGIGEGEVKVVSCLYGAEMMEALVRRAGRERHLKVMQWLLERYGSQLPVSHRGELDAALKRYRRGEEGRLGVLERFANRLPGGEVAGQLYLDPELLHLSGL